MDAPQSPVDREAVQGLPDSGLVTKVVEVGGLPEPVATGLGSGADPFGDSDTSHVNKHKVVRNLMQLPDKLIGCRSE